MLSRKVGKAWPEKPVLARRWSYVQAVGPFAQHVDIPHEVERTDISQVFVAGARNMLHPYWIWSELRQKGYRELIYLVYAPKRLRRYRVRRGRGKRGANTPRSQCRLQRREENAEQAAVPRPGCCQRRNNVGRGGEGGGYEHLVLVAASLTLALVKQILGKIWKQTLTQKAGPTTRIEVEARRRKVSTQSYAKNGGRASSP